MRNGKRTHPRGGGNSTVRSRRLHSPGRLRGPISRRARPRSTAGNGKTMAEKSQKTTQKQAKGKTSNGSASKTTARRAGVPTRPAAERQKTPPAAAKAQKPPEQSHQPAEPENPQPPRHGIEVLREKARERVENHADILIDALVAKALKGFATSMDILCGPAAPEKPHSASSPEENDHTAEIRDWASQPEYQDCDGHPDEPQPGRLETVHAVAED
jgi:hypothetical protein